MKRPDDTPRVARPKTAGQALHLLMDRCARQEVSSGDARHALFRWKVDPADHQQILDTLTKEKFIDDSRYAAAYVREKAQLNHWGIHKIRAGLRTRQIAEGTIAEAVAQLETMGMNEKLEDRLRRKMRTVKSKNAYDLRGKLLRYGTGSGFDYSEVAEMVGRLVEEDE